jgi:hypothetical protein
MSRAQNLETTLGNLIAALTDEAISLVPHRKTAYRCVSYILSELVRKRRVRFKNNGTVIKGRTIPSALPSNR